MTRTQRIVAVIGAAILAVPGINMVAAMVIFPIFFYGFIAIVANFAPIGILLLRAVSAAGISISARSLVTAWQYCGILWLGCAFGLSRWGDAGASIGGKNTPYLHVLQMPWHGLLSFLAA